MSALQITNGRLPAEFVENDPTSDGFVLGTVTIERDRRITAVASA